MSASDKQRDEEELAGRLPSLEEQTPGLDTEQVRRTDKDAVAYYSRGESSDEGDQGSGEGRQSSEPTPRGGQQ